MTKCYFQSQHSGHVHQIPERHMGGKGAGASAPALEKGLPGFLGCGLDPFLLQYLHSGWQRPPCLLGDSSRRMGAMLPVLSSSSLWGRPIFSSFSRSSSSEEEEVEEEETAMGACTATSSSLGPSRGKSCAMGFSSVSGCSLAVTPEVLVRGHQVGPAKGRQQRQPWPSSWQQACGWQGGHRNGALRGSPPVTHPATGPTREQQGAQRRGLGCSVVKGLCSLSTAFFQTAGGTHLTPPRGTGAVLPFQK